MMHASRDPLKMPSLQHRGISARLAVAAAFIFVLVALSAAPGCGGGSTGDGGAARPGNTRESIYGEVVEVTEASGEDRKAGIVGWVGIEGARSQAVEEAFVAITGRTSIIDRRSGQDVRASLGAVALMQTVQVTFEATADPTYRESAAEIVICP